ncbi:MAG: hypothetical protein ABGY28_07475 [bacterium]|nr:hypothetical protein [Candidatus Binatota bacterium]
MDTVLLILGPAGADGELVEAAANRASKAGTELVLLAVSDPERVSDIVSRVCEAGQIGSRPSGDLADTLHERQEKLLVDQSQQLVGEFQEKGLACRLEFRRGDAVAETAAVITSLTPDCVVIEQRKRSVFRLVKQNRFLDDLREKFKFTLLEV